MYDIGSLSITYQSRLQHLCVSDAYVDFLGPKHNIVTDLCQNCVLGLLSKSTHVAKGLVSCHVLLLALLYQD